MRHRLEGASGVAVNEMLHLPGSCFEANFTHYSAISALGRASGKVSDCKICLTPTI